MIPKTYEAEIEWIGSRSAWIDENIDDIYYPVEIIPKESLLLSQSNQYIIAYPNPFESIVNLQLMSEESSLFRIELLDVTGRVLQILYYDLIQVGETLLQLKVEPGIRKGFYLLQAYRDNEPCYTEKIFKLE